MKKLFNVLKYIIFLSIGIFLFYYVYKGLGVEKIATELKNLKWGWIWLSFVFAILSHLSRAIRWNMLINPLGYKPKTISTFYSVMIMYATNLLIPRGGELARCSILSKSEKIPFGKLVGTVVTERATDTIILVLLVIITIFSQIGVFSQFRSNNPDFGGKYSLIFTPLFWIIIIVAGIASLIIAWKMRHQLKKIALFKKIYDLLENFFLGIKSIKDLKKPGLYIAHSVFIYIMYFFMMYVVLLSFEPTKNMSIIAGLTAFIMGGLAMLMPVQGGIGAWHFMVLETLAIYGLDKVDGKIFALISHTSMNLLIIVLGSFCFVTLPFLTKILKKHNNQ